MLHYYTPRWVEASDLQDVADLCVYGATSAGVTCAIQAAKSGLSVVLLNPGQHVGGLTTGGLGETDFGKQQVIGGTAREFYRRAGQVHGTQEQWHFYPSAARQAIEGMLKDAGVCPILGQYLESVEVSGGAIQTIRMLGGRRVSAKVFVDATYEGDLMAMAGVSFTVGREGNGIYGETVNGVQVRHSHQFVPASVDPFVIEGDSASGLLPFVEPVDLSKHQGDGDRRLQAYNFRICMTDDPSLRIPFQRPDGYDPLWQELAVRWYRAEKDRHNDSLQDAADDRLAKFDLLQPQTPGGFRKTDTNNHGPVSSDFIGANWDWPLASYARREEIFQAHVRYQKGLYWLLANDPRIPDRYRNVVSRWGLAKDEFVQTGGWSPQLYVREARRMIGQYILTEADCRHQRKCPDPVGMGSYNLDSHNATRFVNAEGKVQNEGDVQVAPAGPYGISYGCLTPKRGECRNLLVPVCCSTSHIAYGSVRMEPVFMVLGQSAAAAAELAIKDAVAVQDVSYTKLEQRLADLGQVMLLD